ncbi:MAG: PilW family protein [Culicoidibacterales bacterium]
MRVNQKGITLVELLATLAITGLVTTLIFQLLAINTTGMQNNQVKAQLQRDTAIAFETVQDLAYSASGIAANEDNTIIQFCYADTDQTKQIKLTEVVRSLEEIEFMPEANQFKLTLNFKARNGRHDVTYSETTTVRMRNYQEGTTCNILTK